MKNLWAVQGGLVSRRLVSARLMGVVPPVWRKSRDRSWPCLLPALTVLVQGCGGDSGSSPPGPVAPPVATDFTLAEGGTYLLVPEDIGIEDATDADEAQSFVVVTPPERGALQQLPQEVDAGTWRTLTTDDAFTLGDILGERIRYVHDGSEDRADGFVLRGGGVADDTRIELSIILTGVDDPPLALNLVNILISLPEDADLSGQIKIADIQVTDTDGGARGIELIGRDADQFELNADQTALFLRANTTLDHETLPELQVRVQFTQDPLEGRDLAIEIGDIDDQPSAIALVPVRKQGVGIAIAETQSETSTTRQKVADIRVVDDDAGPRGLALFGVDRDLFELNADQTELYLKAGVMLDHEVDDLLSVGVQVAGAPDVRTNLSIPVLNIPDAPLIYSNDIVERGLALNADQESPYDIAILSTDEAGLQYPAFRLLAVKGTDGTDRADHPFAIRGNDVDGDGIEDRFLLEIVRPSGDLLLANPDIGTADPGDRRFILRIEVSAVGDPRLLAAYADLARQRLDSLEALDALRLSLSEGDFRLEDTLAAFYRLGENLARLRLVFEASNPLLEDAVTELDRLDENLKNLRQALEDSELLSQDVIDELERLEEDADLLRNRIEAANPRTEDVLAALGRLDEDLPRLRELLPIIDLRLENTIMELAGLDEDLARLSLPAEQEITVYVRQEQQAFGTRTEWVGVSIQGGTDDDFVDRITGSENDDTLQGLGGDDQLFGAGGNDTLVGGTGADALDGGAGSDTADYSGTAAVTVDLSQEAEASGEDAGFIVLGDSTAGDKLRSIENLIGSDASDMLTGDDTVNTLTGGKGADTLVGGAGADFLDGVEGEDTVSYASSIAGGVTVTLGTTTRDRLSGVPITVGGAAADGDADGDRLHDVENLIGSPLNDVLRGNSAANRLAGLGAADTLIGAGGGDSMDGGEGLDTVSYGASGVGVTLDLATIDAEGYASGTGGDAEGDRIRDVENIIGSDHADTLTGDADANTLTAGLGADKVSGGAGDDHVLGGGGSDTLAGGAGRDTLSYEEITSVTSQVTVDLMAPVDTGGFIVINISGTVDRDRIKEFENLIGGSGDDSLLGTAGDNTLTGGPGKDMLDGRGGRDWAVYRNSPEGVTIYLDDGGASDFINGTGGEADGDILQNIENVEGSDYADILVGDRQDNSFLGRGGGDMIDGAGGRDMVDYAEAEGAVIVDLSADADEQGYLRPGGAASGDRLMSIENVAGSPFSDQLTGDAGENLLIGALGADRLTGGAGGDVFAWLRPGPEIDVVTDFLPGEDRIDLSVLAAGLPNGRFTFIGDGKFSAGGQIRYRENGDDLLVEVNLDSDVAPELSFFLAGLGIPGSARLSASDFVRTLSLIEGGDLNFSILPLVTEFPEGISSRLRVAEITGTGLMEEGGSLRVEVGGRDADFFMLASDPDSGRTYLYLRPGQTLDHEDRPSLDVRIQAVDGAGLEGVDLRLLVTDVNEPPAFFADSRRLVVQEGGSTRLALANLRAMDEDGGDSEESLRFMLLRELPVYGILQLQDDVGVWSEIGSGSSFSAQDLDTGRIRYLNSGSEQFSDRFRVQVEDDGGGRTEMVVGIDVQAVDDDPQRILVELTRDSNGDPITLLETESTQELKVADFSWRDPDGGEFDLLLTGGDAGLFAIRNKNLEAQRAELWLLAGNSLDYETSPLVAVRINASTGAEISAFTDVSIDIRDVDEPLTVPTPSASSRLVVERAADGSFPDGGVVLGQLLAEDPEEPGAVIEIRIVQVQDEFGVPLANIQTLNPFIVDSLGFIRIRERIAPETAADESAWRRLFTENNVFTLLTEARAVGGGSSQRAETILYVENRQDLSSSVNRDPIINGEEDRADRIIGGDGDETISGLGGPDRLSGSGGRDSLLGGAGNDVLAGDAGDDFLVGGGGQDLLDGGDDADTVSYAQFDAAANVGVSIDLAVSAAIGDGLLEAGYLPVQLADASGAIDGLKNIEHLIGSGYADTLIGSPDVSNSLVGGAGDDTLAGGGGGDNLAGGPDQDLLFGGNVADVLDGGTGVDTLSYAASGEGVTIDLAGISVLGNYVVATGGDAEGDRIRGVEDLIGSNSADILKGDEADNRIAGGAGNDILHGVGSRDKLEGSSGLDTLYGGDGDDSLLGGTGGDSLYGEQDSDVLMGGVATDLLSGGSGDDTLDGGAGGDVLDGGPGDADVASYVLSNAGVTVHLHSPSPGGFVTGASGGHALNDSLKDVENLIGSTYGDALSGDDGANYLDGGAGDDFLDGRGGDDTLLGGGGFDTLDGGAGTDLLSYAESTAVWVNLGAAEDAGGYNLGGAGGNAQGDRFRNVENLQGSDYDDILIGDQDANLLIGGAGADTLIGNDGTDTASYQGSDSVTVSLSAARDAAGFVAVGADAGGDAAGDRFQGIENLVGSAYGDILTGDEAANRLDGTDGEDSLAGAGGDDVLIGGDQDDDLDGGAQDDNLAGGAGRDTLRGGGGNDTLIGGADADRLDGGGGRDLVSYVGSGGAVTLDLAALRGNGLLLAFGGDAAGDSLENVEDVQGSAYDDRLTGDNDQNLLAGGAGADTLTGAGGDDLLAGGADGDLLDGGAGTDALTYQDSDAGVTVNLSGRLDNSGYLTDASGGHAEGDRFKGIESLQGSGHADRLEGNFGNNSLVGGAGNDTLRGDKGDDSLFGGAGDDILQGGVGADVLDGGSDRDQVSYVDSQDAVTVDLTAPFDAAGYVVARGGFAEGDRIRNVEILQGSAHSDTLIGLPGGDVAVSYSGSTDAVTVNLSGAVDRQGFLVAGGGHAEGDKLKNIVGVAGSRYDDVFGADASANTFDGGVDGMDTVTYSVSTAAVTVALAELDGSGYALAFGGHASNDRLRNIENVTGSVHNDVLRGDNSDNVLEGGAGGDVLNGAGGQDTSSYVRSNVSVTVDLSQPLTSGYLELGPAAGGHAAGDRLKDIENLRGSAFVDRLTGDSGNNILSGGAGGDVLDGAGGQDTSSYEDSPAAVIVDLSQPLVSGYLELGPVAGGHAAGDRLKDVEHILGSAHDDTLIGTGASRLDGGGGDDVLQGGATSTLIGGAGVDTASYVGSTASFIIDLRDTSGGGLLQGVENLIGGRGADTFIGGDGANTLEGGPGGDSLTGGLEDTLSYIGSSAGVTIDLSAQLGSSGFIELGDTAGGDAVDDRIRDFNNVHGSELADVLTGDDGDNRLFGAAGDDSLTGGAGGDVLDGGVGVRDIASYVDSPAGVSIDLRQLVNIPGPDFGYVVLGEDAGGHAVGDRLRSISGIEGSDFNDFLIGDADPNFLLGGRGTDVLQGGGESDELDGGAGFDALFYLQSDSAVTVDLSVEADSRGFVRAIGGHADGDLIAGIEQIVGSTFDDTLIGSDQQVNLLVGWRGADVLDGGEGDGDIVSYVGSFAGVSVDLSQASSVDEFIDLGSAAGGHAAGDQLRGFEGLVGSSFADTLIGNARNNLLEGGNGADKIDGGDGIDTLSYANSNAGVTVLLSSAPDSEQFIVVDESSGLAARGDRIRGIENLSGSGQADILGGDAEDNVLRGLNGDDTLSGGAAGEDSLIGGDGIDTADYSGADETASVNANLALSLQPSGFAEGDVLDSIENLLGGAGGDNLRGSNGKNRISGGTGVDRIAGAEGDDILLGDDGDDVLNGDDNDDTLYGGADQDRLSGGNGADTLFGGVGADILDGGGGVDLAAYTESADAVTIDLGQIDSTTQTTGFGGEANSDLLKNIENLAGSGHADILSGNSVGNLLQGGEGDDILEGRVGADRLDGGPGRDTASYFDSPLGVTINLTQTAVDNSDDRDSTNDADNGYILLVGEAGSHAAGDGLLAIENLRGSSFADRLVGDNGANLLQGEDGDDTLIGGFGFDTLIGGAGGDTLTGGLGEDVFAYTRESNVVDRILDFTSGVDRIDLSGLAFEGTAGNIGAYEYLGTGAFSQTDASGQVRYFVDGSGIVVEVSTDFDAETELRIRLEDIAVISIGDFLLGTP